MVLSYYNYICNKYHNMKMNSINTVFATAILLFISSNLFAQKEAEAHVIQDSKIPALLQLKSQMIKDNELADRYKIQIMGFGNLKDANEVLDKYKEALDKWPANVAYQSPNYKVWVGHFPNRLEADRALLEVKKEFPNAFVFQPK